MLDFITNLFKDNGNEISNELTQELLELISQAKVNNKLKSLLATADHDCSEEEINTLILICQLFSYRLVIRSNDIPLSFSLLESTYDQLVQELKELDEMKVKKDTEQIKEKVEKLVEVYKSSEQQRKIVKVEEAVKVLIEDVSTPMENKNLKNEIKDIICHYITLIQDFFTSKTSNL
ncbi:hypothetical protein [Halanaerobacter jeridensis]|uniref:Gas vesicle protein n=1 Tax=Halanaerobacter jeridensis TaxID=706427 RepID=A0A938XWI4_9FIRM|nr:hypothetical protein [Halanaerobacter jeridensis]MBM7556937.1 gas vesicle protein [Halanaerobacter jeridensis]